jgi:hypothetical protein
MSDPFLTLGRLVMLVLVPTMLLFPLVFALLVPNRTQDEVRRLKARAALAFLAQCTALALGLWIALLVVGIRFPFALSVASFWWCLFFPLWFGLAMPAVAAKNPALSGRPEDTMPRASNASGAPGSPGSAPVVRTASLVNRERQSPVTRAMWAIPVAVFVAAVAAVALRGLAPFPMHPHGAEDELFASAERSRWLLTLGIEVVVLGISLAILPHSLRRTLTEPEPMDAAGSPELAELYRVQRRRRVLGLFWGGGVVLPAFMGTVLALPVWFPDQGGLWGLLGGIGGTAIGIAGAVFGTMMSVERARIAQARARLEQARASKV